ncbi:MAG: hypothetical protein ACJ8AW_08230 [Rhodopila sp.]
MNQRLVQYSPEMEAFEAFQAGSLAAQRSASNTGVFNENQLLELAAEVLEASSENTLNHTLDRLIDRAFRTLGRTVDPALARALQATLRGIARRVLPFASGPLGNHSSTTVARAGRQFGLELEGLSPEDKEFELAKHFVRLAGEAVRRAIALPHAAPPQTLASRAVAEAARQEAPGLSLDPTGERSGVRDFTTAYDSKELTMHDIDRTQMEYSNEYSGFQGEQFEFGESEWSPEAGGIFSEAEEVQLASELLSVSNEAELDRFLGDLVSKATKAVGSFVRSPIGQAVGGVLKGVAKKALPLAGAAVGTYFGGPLGAKIGSGLANAAGNALGLEGEMVGEDHEFEGAKQFVRLAGQTAAAAAAAPPGANPRVVAQQAAVEAAKQYAPGLLTGTGTPSRGSQQLGATGGARNGHWLRRGNKIVLYGA